MSNRKHSTETDQAKDSRALCDAELNAVVGAAFDALTSIGDIRGESTEKGHKDWVLLLDYHH